MRSLLDCLNARWPIKGEYIKCSKGHKLGNGKVHIRQVDRGDKLICKICQKCTDYTPFDKDYISMEEGKWIKTRL